MAIHQASQPAELDVCADIWLESSLAAHDFIPAEFWLNNKERMIQEYLPAAVVFLATSGGIPAGFAALGDSRLEALFVRPSFQGSGIGRALLEHIFSLGGEPLTLSVYRKNTRAVRFYQYFGFEPLSVGRCPQTGEVELTMSQKKPSPEKVRAENGRDDWI